MPAWNTQTLANGAGGVGTQRLLPEQEPVTAVVPHALAVVLHVHGGTFEVAFGAQLPAKATGGAVRTNDPGLDAQPVVTQRPGGSPREPSQPFWHAPSV
jgi:hypothetical protein